MICMLSEKKKELRPKLEFGWRKSSKKNKMRPNAIFLSSKEIKKSYPKKNINLIIAQFNHNWQKKFKNFFGRKFFFWTKNFFGRKMSFPAEQLAALLRQTQQIAEMKANEQILKDDGENISRNSESPRSNHSANSEQVGNLCFFWKKNRNICKIWNFGKKSKPWLNLRFTFMKEIVS